MRAPLKLTDSNTLSVTRKQKTLAIPVGLFGDARVMESPMRSIHARYGEAYGGIGKYAAF
jgi:hypothetical protein